MHPGHAAANLMSREGCNLPAALPEFHRAPHGQMPRLPNRLLIIWAVELSEAVDVPLTVEQVSAVQPTRQDLAGHGVPHGQKRGRLGQDEIARITSSEAAI